MTVHAPPEPPAWMSSTPPPSPVVIEPVGYRRIDWHAPQKADRGPGPHDTIAASALLGIHFVATTLGVASGIALQTILRAVFTRRGLGYFESSLVASAQLNIVVSQLVLFGASAVLTFVLMRRKRRSFYVPLVALLVAALVFWTLMMPPLWADHSLRTVA